MPVEAIERSERSKSVAIPMLMERLERLAEQILERLERSPREEVTPQKPPPKTMSAPVSGDMFAEVGDPPAALGIPTSGDRDELINWMITAKDTMHLSCQKIADILNAHGIPTFSGKGTWQKGNVERFYKGKAS